jgi:PST family polysaccharide transporter
MLALFIGPAGMAVTGNFRNMLTPLEVFSTLGMQNGITKYTADTKGTNKLYNILATSFIVIAAAVLVLMVLLLCTAAYWSLEIFNTTQYIWIIMVLAITLPLYAGNLVFIAILNGLGNFKQVIYLNMLGNVIGVLSTAVMIWQFGLGGALLSLAIYPSILFFFSIYHVYREFNGFAFVKRKYFDVTILKGLLSYSFMSVVTAILGPAIYIGIRNMIIDNYSIAQAGYYEGVNRIASFYLMFAATMLTVYFLPKLTTSVTKGETRRVFYSYYKSVVPLFAIGLFTIYVLRVFIIKLLFAKNFLPMENLFLWQLTGDFFKVCALILGFEFFAKKMTKAYILVEVLSFIVLYVSSHLLISGFGAEGAVMAYAITYFIDLLVLTFYFRKVLF